MIKIIRFIFMLLLCLNLNVNSNKKDYLNEKAGDVVGVLNNSIYSMMLSNSPNRVFNKGYYAPYYFKNLINNFPNNTHNTCSYTALTMFLSYYDSYWHDCFIPNNFENNIVNTSNEIPNVFNLYSPGVYSEDEINSSLSESQYNSFIESSSNYFFQSYLIIFARLYGIVNSSSFELTSLEMKDLLTIYLESIDLYEPIVFIEDSINKNVMTWTRQMVSSGVPVLLNIRNKYTGNIHTVVAYDIEKESGQLFVHTGWKKNGTALTHVPISLIANEIIYGVTMAPNFNHSHTNNYKFGNGDSICSCKFMNPNNIYINASSNYVDTYPIYEWDAASSERWIDGNKFNYTAYILDNNNNLLFKYDLDKFNTFTLRPSDWIEMLKDDDTYKICILIDYDNSLNDYYDSYSLKTFTKPTIAKDNPYLTPTSANVPTNGLASPTYNNYSINNNSFSISYQRVRYIQNDDLLSMCSIGGTNNRSFMIFNFSTPITRMDIDLGIYTYLKYNSNDPSSTYKDSRVDLTKGNYKINILENENGSFVEVKKIVEELELEECEEVPPITSYNKVGPLKEELTSTEDNLERVNIYFDRPISSFVFNVQFLGDDTFTSTLGEIAVGNMYFYNYDEISEDNPLPLSGYELPYEPEKWNNSFSKIDSSTYIYEETNCYSYALNAPYQINSNGDLELWKVDPGYNSYAAELDEYYWVWDSLYADSTSYNFLILPLSKYEVCPIGMYKIAFFGDKSRKKDFHFFRQNSDGTWSHKTNGTIVTILDDNGEIVMDPETASIEQYDSFVSYFAITPLNTFDLGDD